MSVQSISSVSTRPEVDEPVSWQRLLAEKQVSQAIVLLEKACQQEPNNPQLFFKLAIVCETDGRHAQALKAIEQVQQIAPGAAALRAVWPLMAWQRVPSSVQAQQESLFQVVERFAQNMTWLAEDPAHIEAVRAPLLSLAPFTLAYAPFDVTQALAAWGQWVATVQAQAQAPCEPGASPADGEPVAQTPASPFRLAIVSAHVHRHSVWNVLLMGLLHHAARAGVELIIFGDAAHSDEQTEWALSRCTRAYMDRSTWPDALVREKPDAILYPELGMEPSVIRLASQRLAPVQAVWWGHPITSGLPTIDLFFSGEQLEGPDADSHYTERLVRLHGTGACTPLFQAEPEPLPPHVESLLAAGQPVALIPAVPFKLNVADDALWATLLSDNPDLHLVFFELRTMANFSRLTHTRIAKAVVARSPSAAQRLHVWRLLGPGEFQTLLSRADLYLDVPTFSGYTTALQGVLAGLPIVTQEGRFLRQRLAAGLLKAIGQPDTVVQTADEYSQKVKELLHERATNPLAWAVRRSRLREAAPRACNDKRPVLQMLDVLQAAAHYARNPPASQ